MNTFEEPKRELGYGKIIKSLATLSKSGELDRYVKEVNIIEWKKSGEVIDIRTWDTWTGHARKGVTIAPAEVPALIAALTAYMDTWETTGTDAPKS